ncbi:hypothetical protein [Nostoc sp.]
MNWYNHLPVPQSSPINPIVSDVLWGFWFCKKQCDRIRENIVPAIAKK